MATILVTHGIPAEGFSLLSGEKIVIPKPLMQFSMDELAALIPAADAVVAKSGRRYRAGAISETASGFP